MARSGPGMAERVVSEPVALGLARQRRLLQTLRLLRPYDLPGEKKVRVGAPGDGSYVLVDRPRPAQAVMSFGVGPSISFEQDLAARGHEIFLFDHTVAALPTNRPRLHWRRLGVEGVADHRNSLFTLAELCRHLPAAGDAPILKMDIEGSEWSVLAATPKAVLAGFEQIALELHDLTQLGDQARHDRVRMALLQLSAFTLCHVHVNNFSGVEIAEGIQVPRALEATYVRSDLCARAPSRTFYPTPIDTPNYPHWPDPPLWFFPFMPGSERIGIPDGD